MTDHSESAEVRVKKMRAQAEKGLAGHVLLGETYWDQGRGARWCLGRPAGGSQDKVEIIAGVGCSLVVHGDHDGCRFAYGPGNAWARLLWMADHRDGSYIWEKGRLGDARQGDPEYAAEVARHDLEQHAKDREEEDPELAELFREAIAHVETEHELREFLHENDQGWDLWEYSIGTAPRWAVVWGHSALIRCAALLREKHGADGPPECRIAEGRAA